MITKSFCEHCGGHMEFEAEHSGVVVACPHCNKETTFDVNRQVPAAPKTATSINPPPVINTKPGNSKISMLRWIGIGIALFALMFIGFLIIGINSQPAKISIQDEATAYGLDVISNALVCPSTVKFLEVKCERFGNTFRVSGREDSQNRMGAMVRNSFNCGITNDGSSFDWVDLMVGDDVQVNPDFKYEPIKILSSEDHVWHDNGYDFKSIRGFVQNVSQDKINSIIIMYDIYTDTNDNLPSKQAHAYIFGGLSPGQTTNFETDYFEPKQTAYFKSISAN